MRLLKLMFVVWVFAPFLAKGDPKGDWQTIPVFFQEPLEIKLGAYSSGPNPDLLAVVLWNDGSNNRLQTVRIPPPYNGTGITGSALDSSSVLFALGDICTDGSNGHCAIHQKL